MDSTKKEQILVSWVGDTDFVEIAQSNGLTEEQKAALAGALQSDRVSAQSWLGRFRGQRQISPLAQMVRMACSRNGPYTRVFALCTRPEPFAGWLREHLKEAAPMTAVTIRPVDMPDPMDMGRCCALLKGVLECIPSGATASFNLTSGTSAMVAAQLLLGKTGLAPDRTRFLVAYGEKVSEQDIPFDLSLVARDTIRLEQARINQEIQGETYKSILGDSPEILKTKSLAKRMAPYVGMNVMILGPNGSGKELFARTIHEESGRGKGPFVPVNCASFAGNEQLADDELFGHRKGAFTDAKGDRKGYFAEAEGGTLFLDEIGDLPPMAQSKLLRALMPRTGESPTLRHFTPLGARAEEDTADVRIIAATNRDMTEAIESGKFREDLWFRLQDYVLRVPALAERRDDIPVLARDFLDKANVEFGKALGERYFPKVLSDDALDFLQNRPWPGNVRELRQTIRRGASLSDSPTLFAGDLRDDAAQPGMKEEPPLPSEADFSLDAVTATLQRRYIAVAREIAGGNEALTARLLGFKSRQALVARCRSLEASREGKRSSGSNHADL